MMTLARSMLRNAMILGVFAAVTTGMIAGFNQLTSARIEASRQEELAKTLNTLLPASEYDNALLTDTLTIQDDTLLGHQVPETVWRATRQGQPVAVLFPVIAPDGYSGRIRLLVAIRANGEMAGVRALAHRETPGLGDAIEAAKSDWILGFNGKSLQNPDESGWQVRKDGGVIDQFTGATITPRAVVKAVHLALLYYRDHREMLFTPAPHPEKS
ncbi:MAG: electron transport complex subunit RsxG [Fluviicoccus sp.]|uniref:electron transport complex subunit RsxG n=1 Tax=Fluviicoccus sp. TaxID=2003552 RepID=UPI00272595D1|nr:electron transport complex subunit RsxG [Fluviicoccus sp.]MDO8329137.1 electron transport complex subunit RsxG [Fluviicoccus sp.]